LVDVESLKAYYGRLPMKLYCVVVEHFLEMRDEPALVDPDILDVIFRDFV
jgi:hypothetical protein